MKNKNRYFIFDRPWFYSLIPTCAQSLPPLLGQYQAIKYSFKGRQNHSILNDSSSSVSLVFVVSQITDSITYCYTNLISSEHDLIPSEGLVSFSVMAKYCSTADFYNDEGQLHSQETVPYDAFSYRSCRKVFYFLLILYFQLSSKCITSFPSRNTWIFEYTQLTNNHRHHWFHKQHCFEIKRRSPPNYHTLSKITWVSPKITSLRCSGTLISKSKFLTPHCGVSHTCPFIRAEIQQNSFTCLPVNFLGTTTNGQSQEETQLSWLRVKHDLLQHLVSCAVKTFTKLGQCSLRTCFYRSGFSTVSRYLFVTR